MTQHLRAIRPTSRSRHGGRRSWTVSSTAIGLLAAVSVGTNGCSTLNPDSGTASGTIAPRTPNSATSSSSQTAGGDTGPSAFARSICESKLRSDLTATLGFTAEVPAAATWRDDLYRCTYFLPVGQLVLTVKQSPDSTSARAYFDALRQHLSRPETVRGLYSLGVPAFSTPAGQTVYLEGSDTLEVDGSGLPPTVGVYGETRNALAAQIAIRVIWPDT